MTKFREAKKDYYSNLKLLLASRRMTAKLQKRAEKLWDRMLETRRLDSIAKAKKRYNDMAKYKKHLEAAEKVRDQRIKFFR